MKEQTNPDQVMCHHCHECKAPVKGKNLSKHVLCKPCFAKLHRNIDQKGFALRDKKQKEQDGNHDSRDLRQSVIFSVI